MVGERGTDHTTWHIHSGWHQNDTTGFISLANG